VIAASAIKAAVADTSVANGITANSLDPSESFPNNVFVGQSPNVPQRTEQKKWQFRDDFSWHMSGLGLGHDFKTGVNFINEPHLFTTFNGGRRVVVYTHTTNDLDGPISSVSFSDGDAAANLPMKQLGLYIQDDWRLNTTLTLNLGLRYDVMTGYQIDQSADPNFVVLQAAGRSGRLNGLIGFEDFGKDPREDYNNVQPRVGLVFDVSGQGHDVVRASWGIYTDVGYTSSNILIGAADASPLGFGPTFAASNPNGLRNPDGSFFRAGQPLSDVVDEAGRVTTGLVTGDQGADGRAGGGVDRRQLPDRADAFGACRHRSCPGRPDHPGGRRSGRTRTGRPWHRW